MRAVGCWGWGKEDLAFKIKDEEELVVQFEHSVVGRGLVQKGTSYPRVCGRWIPGVCHMDPRVYLMDPRGL